MIKENKMERQHQFSLKRLQSIRVFDLIQQKNLQLKTILTSDQLHRFLQGINPQYNQNTVKLLHSMDKLGRQMNSSYFGYCISLALQQQEIINQYDLHQFHENIKRYLCGNYYGKFTQLDSWDKSKINNDQEQINRIQLFPQDHSPPNLAFMDKIVPYLSIITLHPKYQKKSIEQYLKLLNKNFIGCLQNSLFIHVKNNEDITSDLQCLCYLYTSLKYQEIQIKLVNGDSNFLFDQQVWIFLVSNYNNLSVNAQYVKYLTSVLMALLSKHIPKFVTRIWTSELFEQTCNYIGQLKDNQGLSFSIEYLTNLVRGFKYQDEQWKKQKQIYLSQIYMFAIGKLRQPSYGNITKSALLKLIEEVTSNTKLSQDKINKLKYLTDIFQSNNLILEIKMLKLIQNWIVYQKMDLANIFLYDSSFLKYITKILKSHLNPQRNIGEPIFLILHFLYLLNVFDYTKYLFQQDLIQSIFNLSESKNTCIKAIICQIILKLVQKSADSHWRVPYLHEKNILNEIGQVFKSCSSIDPILATYSPYDQTFVYFNKRFFQNSLKSVFLLSDTYILKQNTANKSLFLKYCNQKFINDILSGLDLFFYSKPQQYIKQILKQQVSVQCNNKIILQTKLYKLIDLILQNFIQDNNQNVNKQVSFYKSIIVTRKFYYSKLYSYFNILELDTNQIPIYITINVIYYRRQFTFTIGRVQWQAVKKYLISNLQYNQNVKINRIKVLDIDRNSFINTQQDYLESIRRVTNNYKQSNFVIRFKIEREFYQNRTQYRQYPKYQQPDRFRSYKIPNQYQRQRAYTPNIKKNALFTTIPQQNRGSKSPF